MSTSRRSVVVALLLAALAGRTVPLAASPAGPLERAFSGWDRTQTEHFVFIYEPRDEAAVRQLVSFAEEVYRQVTDLLGSRPPRVWVVVSGRVDLANGYTTATPPHITLYLAPPSEPLIGLQASQYLRLLLVHELSHFVNFEYGQGMAASLATVFGPGVRDANAAFLPTWFLEGIATEAETLFTDGGRGRNPFFEMEYRALARDGRFFPLSKAAYTSYFPPADRDWIGGFLFFRYLLDRYGREAYARIYRSYVAFPLLGPWKAIEGETGKTADAIYREMIQELQARYESGPRVEEGRRVPPDAIGDWFLPVISNRGWYLYRRTLDDAGAIVRYDPISGGEKVLRVTPLTDRASLTASRAGDEVVFASYRVTLGASGQIVASDLFRLDPATGSTRRITTGARAWQPRLSPDGSRLLAVSAAGSCSRLVEIDPRTGAMALLFSQRDAIVQTPTFSPDGTRVAFTVCAGGMSSIRILELPPAGLALSPDDPLTDFNVERATTIVGPSRAGAWYPRFTEAGRLLYSSVAGGTLALLSTDGEGNEVELACQDPVGAWAGEQVGNDVLYATVRPGGYTFMRKGILHSRLASAVEPEPPSLAEAVIGNGAGEGTGSTGPRSLASARYVDVPRFLAWAPLPVYYSTIASQELVAAPGVVGYGVSNLQRSSWFAAASFRTDALQPAVEASLGTMLGSVGASYSVSEGYTNLSRTDHRQQLIQQASLAVPVVSSTELSTTTNASLSFSVTDALSVRGEEGFDFLQGLDMHAPGLRRSNDVYVTLGTRILRSTQGSARDLFPRGEVDTRAAVSWYPPLLSSSGPGVVASGLFSLALPSLLAHQVVKLGLKASYVGLGGTFYQITNARGAFDPVVQSLPGRTLVSLDYQIPIALLDAPVAYSIGLIGIGCGLHVEAAADWGADPAVFSPDSDLYAGAEVVLDVSLGEQAIPLGLGIVLKFDPRFERPVNWATDLRPYVFVSTNSFDAAARAGGRLPAVQVR